MKIAVLVKFYKGELNPFDGAALESALRYKCERPETKITVITMAPLSVKENLEYLTRLTGESAILVSDIVYSGSDTLATARVLTETLKTIKPDVVLCGRQSIDGDTAQVPPEISERLGFDFIPYAMEFNTQEINTRYGRTKVKLPCVISMEKIYDLRFASRKSIKNNVITITNNDLKIPENLCGLKGSPTKVVETYSNDKTLRKCTYIEPKKIQETINLCLLKESEAEADEIIANKLEKVFVYDKSLVSVAEKIAKQVVVGIESFYKENGKKIMLFDASPYSRVIAPKIAAKLNAGLCADCVGLSTDGQRLFMFRPASGGNIIAKIICESEITLATVRTKTRNDKKLVFGVGYGAREYIDAIKELARKVGAEIVATRKAVDNGLMPYETQVGLTGKIILPSVYVAFGVSGAVQHIVGIENSGTIIAVNCDKNAEIYKYADYGITEDIKNVKL